MPAFSDLISLSYAKTIAGIAQSLTTYDMRVAALITGCSIAAASYCGRQFSPAYRDELYDGSGVGFLVLRSSPLIELVQLTVGPSSDNPLDYTSTDLDIDNAISRVSFKPSSTADFFNNLAVNMSFPDATASTEVTYYAGYGAIMTIAATVAVGEHTVIPNAMYGRTTNGDLWAVDVGSILSIDSGLATEEAVIVTAATSTTFTATFARPHAAGSRALIGAIPSDLQSGIGFMVSNLYRQKDMTKASERLGEYAYTLRAMDRGVAFTPEVTGILNRYKSAFAG